MGSMETWANLEKIFHASARELYEDDALDELHRTSRREVEAMSQSEMRTSLSRYVRDVMLSDDAINRGDGWEVVLSFLDWIDGGME